MKKNGFTPVLVLILVVVIGAVFYLVRQNIKIEKLDETDPAYIEAYEPWVSVKIDNIQLDLPKNNSVTNRDQNNYFRNFTKRYLDNSIYPIPLATSVHIQSPLQDSEQQKYEKNIPSKWGPYYLDGYFGLYQVQNQTIDGFVGTVEKAVGSEQSCKVLGPDMTYIKGVITKLTGDSIYYWPSICTSSVGATPLYLIQRGANVYVFYMSQSPPPKSVMEKIVSSLNVK